MNNKQRTFSTNYLSNVFGYGIIVSIAFFLLFRAFYSFCWSDEAYYIACADRFIRGDRYITDDWFLSQLYSVVLCPIVKVYLAIRGDYEGIYLFVRLLYVIFQTVLSMKLFNVFSRKKGKFVALSAALIFLFYSRSNIITLSYYSAILILYLFMLLLVYEYKNEFWKACLIGLLYSFVVIINPYFVFVYVIFSFTLIVLKKKNSYLREIIWDLYLKSFCGIFLGAIFFLFSIFRGNEVKSILKFIPIILNEKGYETNILKKLVSVCLIFAGRYKYSIVIVLIMSALVVCNRKVRENVNCRVAYCLIAFICFGVNCISHDNWRDGILGAFAIWGFQIFLIDEERDMRVFGHFYIPGMILAVITCLSSDTGFSAMTIGIALSACVSTFFLIDYAKRIEGKNNLFTIMAMASIVLAVMIPGYIRFAAVYRDDNLLNLTAKIESGPAAGLYTTVEHKSQYESIMRVIDLYCNREGNLIISSICPWAYLYSEMNCASFTTWRINTSENEEKLKLYYETHKEKLPEVVIKLNDNVGDFEIQKYFDDVVEYACQPQKDDYFENSCLADYINSNEFEVIEFDYGKVYIINSGMK